MQARAFREEGCVRCPRDRGIGKGVHLVHAAMPFRRQIVQAGEACEDIGFAGRVQIAKSRLGAAFNAASEHFCTYAEGMHRAVLRREACRLVQRRVGLVRHIVHIEGLGVARLGGRREAAQVVCPDISQAALNGGQ